MLNFSKGQLVSNKKEELLSILDNFNIQVFAKQNFSVQALMQQNEIIIGAMSLCWYEDVIYFFFLQVNNPVSVLTQEMSKYFLHSKGEGDKYKVTVCCSVWTLPETHFLSYMLIFFF